MWLPTHGQTPWFGRRGWERASLLLTAECVRRWGRRVARKRLSRLGESCLRRGRRLLRSLCHASPPFVSPGTLTASTDIRSRGLLIAAWFRRACMGVPRRDQFVELGKACNKLGRVLRDGSRPPVRPCKTPSGQALLPDRGLQDHDRASARRLAQCPGEAKANHSGVSARAVGTRGGSTFCGKCSTMPREASHAMNAIVPPDNSEPAAESHQSPAVGSSYEASAWAEDPISQNSPAAASVTAAVQPKALRYWFFGDIDGW